MYFLKGWHLREFGFPRNDSDKKFKWKKMNFTTDLPKHSPDCTYLVATCRFGKESYRMHVVTLSSGTSIFLNLSEYSVKYRKPEVLKYLRVNKLKLLEEDQTTQTDRVLLCHCLSLESKEPSKKRSKARLESSEEGESEVDFEEEEEEKETY